MSEGGCVFSFFWQIQAETACLPFSPTPSPLPPSSFAELSLAETGEGSWYLRTPLYSLDGTKKCFGRSQKLYSFSDGLLIQLYVLLNDEI